MLIHVGYSKAGSTWLQQDLFFRPASGFDSPGGSRSSSSSPIPIGSRPRTLGVFEPGIEATRQRGLVAVISDEWLTGNQVTADYRGKLITERLAAVFPGARVLVDLREQESMLLSSYREYVVCGGGEMIEELIGVVA
jgi:hypothetical protein